MTTAPSLRWLLLAVLTLTGTTFAGENKNAIRDLMFDTSQDARRKLHEVANQCIEKLATIPAEQKTSWCKDQLARQLKNEERILGDESRLGAGCQDDACRSRAALNAKAMSTHAKERIDQLKAQIARCDKDAPMMLEQRCKQIESSFHAPMD